MTSKMEGAINQTDSSSSTCTLLDKIFSIIMRMQSPLYQVPGRYEWLYWLMTDASPIRSERREVFIYWMPFQKKINQIIPSDSPFIQRILLLLQAVTMYSMPIRLLIATFSACRWARYINGLGLQSRLRKKPLKLQVLCPQNGTAVLKAWIRCS